jgi:ribosomal-protein-alanine N-acetyltransferase
MELRVVRPMETGDIPRILEIERESFPTPWTEGMFHSQLRFADRSINVVLVDAGRVVGYAAAWAAYDEIHLLSIAVDPKRRREGLGSEILSDLILEGRKRRAARMILEVREGNVAARSFYLRHRFRELGIRRRYYTDTGEDAVIMEWLFSD